ncbi:MAG: ribosome silencing factor [Magnetococcales bacterium]|nr:ribosome silencing factor [Magnetococcales bacterium]
MTNPESAALAADLVKRLDDKKAKDVAVVDLEGRSGFADFFVIVTGTSTTHVSTLANESLAFAHERKINVRGIEGMGESAWVLVDLGDVLIHVFLQEAREFYNLERLWSPQARPAKEPKIKEKDQEKEKPAMIQA